VRKDAAVREKRARAKKERKFSMFSPSVLFCVREASAKARKRHIEQFSSVMNQLYSRLVRFILCSCAIISVNAAAGQ
jgi:hypothetical protein